MRRNSRSTAFFPTINARKTKSTQHRPNSPDVAELKPLRRSQSTLPALFNQSQPSMEQSQKPTPESKRSWRNF